MNAYSAAICSWLSSRSVVADSSRPTGDVVVLDRWVLHDLIVWLSIQVSLLSFRSAVMVDEHMVVVALLSSLVTDPGMKE